MGLSPLELAVVVIVVVLLFGVKRLPELGSGMGQAISNFKKSYREASTIDMTPKAEPAKPEVAKTDTTIDR